MISLTAKCKKYVIYAKKRFSTDDDDDNKKYHKVRDH